MPTEFEIKESSMSWNGKTGWFTDIWDFLKIIRALYVARVYISVVTSATSFSTLQKMYNDQLFKCKFMAIGDNKR